MLLFGNKVFIDQLFVIAVYPTSNSAAQPVLYFMWRLLTFQLFLTDA